MLLVELVNKGRVEALHLSVRVEMDLLDNGGDDGFINQLISCNWFRGP